MRFCGEYFGVVFLLPDAEEIAQVTDFIDCWRSCFARQDTQRLWVV